MIPRKPFGRTGHASTSVIFGGSIGLSKATQAEADCVLGMLLEYGINHIDTAPVYGNSERLIGSWMKQHRSIEQDHSMKNVATRCSPHLTTDRSILYFLKKTL